MLARLGFALRIYAKLQVLHLRTYLEYEADFWIGILGVALTHGSGFVFIWSVFQHVPAVDGWSLWEIAFLYALAVIPRGLVEVLCDGQWRLRAMVNRGELDRLLVRPISPALQVITQISSIHGFGSIILGTIILIRALGELSLAWGFWQYGFLLLTLASSVVLLGSVNFASNCIAFWSPDANSAFPFLAQQPLEFVKFPLSLYGRVVQILLTWILPFAFMSYYPGLVLMGRADASRMGYAAPLAGVAVALVASITWQQGLRRYQGAGH
jgi:ABC-2 type transport system permease protein